MKKSKEKPAERVWQELQTLEKLTDEQIEQFKKYESLLYLWNKDINLTAIKSLAGVVRQHFIDSLALRKFVDLKEIEAIADIGSGAGFPSIPLKIAFPHLKLLILEVTNKKLNFLKELVKELDLKDVEFYELDWRTFLRTTEGKIDLFVSRAAFDEVELCRMFRQNCDYKNSKAAYWVSELWEPEKKVEKYLKDTKEYKLAKKLRKITFWENV